MNTTTDDVPAPVPASVQMGLRRYFFLGRWHSPAELRERYPCYSYLGDLILKGLDTPMKIEVYLYQKALERGRRRYGRMDPLKYGTGT